MNFDELDSLVTATDRKDLKGEQLLELQQRIAAQRYYLVDEVHKLSKKASLAEVDRKSALAKVRLKVRAENKTSMAQATEEAEMNGEIIRMRTEEVYAAADYEAAKLKMHASSDVLSSLTMRIAELRQERKESNYHQKT